MLLRRQPPSRYKRDGEAERIPESTVLPIVPAGGEAVRPAAAKSGGPRVFVDVVAIEPDFAWTWVPGDRTLSPGINGGQRRASTRTLERWRQ
jgi:hypothetical protein